MPPEHENCSLVTERSRNGALGRQNTFSKRFTQRAALTLLRVLAEVLKVLAVVEQEKEFLVPYPAQTGLPAIVCQRPIIRQNFVFDLTSLKKTRFTTSGTSCQL